MILAALTFAPNASKANEYYYVMIFGSQTRPKQLRYTHTWAVAVRASGQGSDLSKYALETHTISWLPRTEVVKVWRHRPEPGENLSLEATLRLMEKDRERIIMWGPFVVDKLLYGRFIAVENRLNSGKILYRAIDGDLNLDISDCVHAVAAVDPRFGRLHYPLVRIGIPASRYISRQIMFLSESNQYFYDNSWLIPRLGLNRHPITVVPPRDIPYRGCFLCNHPET